MSRDGEAASPKAKEALARIAEALAGLDGPDLEDVLSALGARYCFDCYGANTKRPDGTYAVCYCTRDD